MSIEAVLRDNLGRERTCTTTHLCSPTGNTVLDHILWRNDPAQTKSWRKRFREAADAAGALALRQGIEACWHWAIEREVAIHVVFNDHEAMFVGQVDDLKTSCLA